MLPATATLLLLLAAAIIGFIAGWIARDGGPVP